MNGRKTGVKILHITYGFNGGGVGFVIANYCASTHCETLQFDIVGERIPVRPMLQDRFEAAGFRVYSVTPKAKNLPKNIHEIKRLLKKGHYDAVHVHMEEWSFLYLGLAKLCRVPVRICHAHMAYRIGEKEKPHYRLFRWLLNRWATCRLACSKDAGRDLYRGKPFTVLNNAIAVDNYRFDLQKRLAIRQALGLKNMFVIGNVARFSYQKNPQMTVEIFREIHNRFPLSVLLLIGQGELEMETRALVQKYDLQAAVMFLGLRNDVPDLLQAMDAFVLPSRFEGLGMVYVEAQAAGLKTFATDGAVPKAAQIVDYLMTFVPQHATAEVWAQTVLRTALRYPRMDASADITRNGYDLAVEIPRLQQIYLRQNQTAGGSRESIS
jgi:glycosyltransferase involved in cell wall biosynthesis